MMCGRWREARFPVGVGFALVVVVACGGSSPVVPIDPVAEAQQASASRVGDSIRQAMSAEEEAGSVTLSVRYNPAGCDCPQWEVAYRGRWLRVFLAADGAAGEELLAGLTEEALSAHGREEEGDWSALDATYDISARLTSDLRRSEDTDMTYRVLLIASSSASDEPAPP